LYHTLVWWCIHPNVTKEKNLVISTRVINFAKVQNLYLQLPYINIIYTQSMYTKKLKHRNKVREDGCPQQEVELKSIFCSSQVTFLMAESTIEEAFQALVDTYGEDVVKEHISSLDWAGPVGESEDQATEEEAPQPAKGGKKLAQEAHTCGYMVNTKADGAKICGKSAKNEHDDGIWYCGTEKSGHYKSVMTASKKEAPKKVVAKAPDAKAKTAALVDKVVAKKAKLNLHETAPGSGIYADLKHHRIVFDKRTQEAYGILDEDNETILPFTDDAVAFLEAHNITFKQEAVPAPKPAPAKSVKAVGAVSKAPAKTVSKAPAPKAPVKAQPAAKTSVPKVAAKTQAKAQPASTKATVAPQSTKVTAKAPAPKAPVKAPAAKAPVKAPAAKAPAKPAKAKVVEEPTQEDQETLDELKQGVEDAATEVDEAEPNPEEEHEEVQEDAESVGDVDTEIDLGGEDEEPGVEEEVDVAEENEEDGQDIEEVEEGEAVEDDGEEEGEAED
jgi:hypothetical protein